MFEISKRKDIESLEIKEAKTLEKKRKKSGKLHKMLPIFMRIRCRCPHINWKESSPHFTLVLGDR